MPWKLKAYVLAVLAHLPGGPALYGAVQNVRAARAQNADELLGRALDSLALYREAGGQFPAGDCLEVGTGWCPWLPLLLRVSGAGRVLTLDLNRWMSHATAIATTRALHERADRSAVALDLDPSELRAQLAPLLAAPTLDSWLEAGRLEYRSPADARTVALPSASISVVFSSNVLEHVSAADLPPLHREMRRLLRPGGLAVHRFNPQDHFAGGDPSITGANFLQFSPREWQALGGTGLAPHNRLRCVQHARLVREAGFDMIVARTRPDPRARVAIEEGALQTHPDFAGMSPTELSDDYMWIAAQPSAAAS
jgi:SAM-dependent methyltransferase